MTKLMMLYGLVGEAATPMDGGTGTPTLTDVFVRHGDKVNEAPVDFKKSFRNASKANKKAGHPINMPSMEVPKKAKAPPKPTLARAGGPDNDPLKTASTAEFFETDAGNYFVYRGLNKRYYAMYVSADMKKVRALGEFSSRAEAIDAMLEHHDKAAAGLGEDTDYDIDAHHDFR